jgi:hypothetical protein
LLKTMYRFFVLTCRIGAKRLPDWQQHISMTGFGLRDSKYFYGGFIKSCIYRRNFP